MTIVYLSAIIFFILFFPLKINTYVYFDIDKKEVLVGVFLLKLKLLSCIIRFSSYGLILTYGHYKSTNLTIKDLLDFNNKLNPFKGYEIKSISFVLELKKTQNFNPENIVVYLKTISDIVGGIVYLNNKNIEYSGNYLINSYGLDNKLNVQISVYFNLFLIILSIIKIFIWKVIECVKKKVKKLPN
jgi:hypothetical protein